MKKRFFISGNLTMLGLLTFAAGTYGIGLKETADTLWGLFGTSLACFTLSSLIVWWDGES